MTTDFRRASACVLAAIVLASCSGGDEPAAEPADTDPTTTAVPPSTQAPTTTRPATTTSVASAPTTDPTTDEDTGSLDEWCALSREAEALTDEATRMFQSGPDGVREYIDEITVLTERANPVVPDELAEAWQVSTQVSELARDAIVAADYDILTADMSAIEDVAAESEAANETIDAFNAEFCGIEPDSGATDDDFDPSLGTLKEQFIATLVEGGFTLDEAECVFDAYDVSATGTIEERDAIVAALDACDIPVERGADIVDGGAG